ncbi:hypothetical protein BsWGS_25376 [Bradybaena similaris]
MDPAMSQLMVVLSISVLASAAAAVCPYDVPACTCTGHTLLCKDLVGLPPLVNNNDDGSITNLTFQSGNLSNIEENSLPGKLQTLKLSDVAITSISSDAFNGSATTLKSFSMSEGDYFQVPDALLKVNSLNELNLSLMDITSWKPEVLQKLGNTVHSVSLVNVNLTSWPQWLENFTLVKSLDLSFNPLNSLPPDAFTNMKNVTDLNLASTSLSDENNLNTALTLLDDTLESLNIAMNDFAQIPSGLLNMSRLTSLDVSSNPISDASNRIPQKLKILNLSRTNLQRLNSTSFPRSSALEKLAMGACQLLTNIDDLAFEPLENLKGLLLTADPLGTIPLALTKLPNLQLLIVTGVYPECNCPPNESLVSWYHQLKTIKVDGSCRSQYKSGDIADYLSNDNNALCSGLNLRANLFIYLLVVLLAVVSIL